MTHVARRRLAVLGSALAVACTSTTFEPSDFGVEEPHGRREIVQVDRNEHAGTLTLWTARPVFERGEITISRIEARPGVLFRWRVDRTLERIEPRDLQAGDSVDYWLGGVREECCPARLIARLR